MSFVITGNPGVGKHTIAKKLSKKVDMSILDINEIVKELKLYSKNEDALDVDVKKLKPKLMKKIQKNMIIVGHLAPYVISKSQVKKVIVLRKNPYKLEKIYQKRSYKKQKTVENLGSEILGIITYDALKNFGKNKVIQIESGSIQKTLNKTISAIQGKHKSEEIDWLSLVSKKNDLEKFFPH